MKKALKAISLILSVMLICTAFTGCNMLDDLKGSHALINKDRNEITYMGYTYIPIEVNDSRFNPLTEQPINVTEEDVPVLLSQANTVYVGQITADGSVMSLNTYYWSENYDDNFYFCREDRYDEINEVLETEPTAYMYFYSYWGFDEDGNEISGDYHLTEEQISVINEIKATAEKKVSETNSFVTEGSVYVYAATEDMIFRWMELFIYKIDGIYFMKEETDVAYCYTVPEEYNPIFDEILAMELSLVY